MEFKNGKYRVLISSNVTARGIDIQQVSTVINFDIPKDVHSYYKNQMLVVGEERVLVLIYYKERYEN